MKKRIDLFGNKKLQADKITMLTCYDYSTARLVASSELDAILIGDSLGMVIQGNEDTLSVTVDDMIYHTKAVKRGALEKFIVTDMPFLSYHTDVRDAVINAGKIIKESGADAVKLEGGVEIIDKVKAILAAKIPVMGHLGLTPQSVNVFGGFKSQGKDLDGARQIIKDALLLQETGVFAIVLECIPVKLAELISKKLSIPTIGIGCGSVTDGQVLVINDAFGIYKEFTPKFVKHFSTVGDEMEKGIAAYIKAVQQVEFPAAEHTFMIDDNVITALEQEF